MSPAPLLPVLSAALYSSTMSLYQRKYRARSGRIMLEGLRSITDALDSGVAIEYCIVASTRVDHHAGVIARLLAANTHVFSSGTREFGRLSDTVQSQGLLAVVRYQSRQFHDAMLDDVRGAVIPVFMHVSDPGNLGTMLRTAEWFGDRLVLLSAGSCDETNPKVTRAAAGSLLRLNVARFHDAAEVIDAAADRGFEAVATVPEGGRPLHALERDRKHLVFFGSEAHGVGDEVARRCVHMLTIPSSGNGESLNLSVACAITLYEFHRP